MGNSTKDGRKMGNLKPLFVLQFRPHGHKTFRVNPFSSMEQVRQVIGEMTMANGGPPEEVTCQQVDRLTGKWSAVEL